MTYVEQLAAFVTQAAYEKLSQQARQALKIHVLDALGCAIGAVESPPLKMLYAQLEDFGGNPLVSLIGEGVNPTMKLAESASLSWWPNLPLKWLHKPE